MNIKNYTSGVPAETTIALQTYFEAVKSA